MSAATIAVRERPILFSGEMVRAILDGRKIQTRRVVNPQPPSAEAVRAKSGSNYDVFRRHKADRVWRVAGPVWAVRDLMAREPGWTCPYGYAGDRLWVRETWQAWTEFDDTRPCDLPTIARTHINYPADGNVWDSRRRPSIHMPRWASRITLELTDVRVERVQEISEEDAKAEGVPEAASIGKFRVLWDEINAKRGYGWDANPYVWCLSFRVVQP